MVQPRIGLDVSMLCSEVLAEEDGRGMTRLANRLRPSFTFDAPPDVPVRDPYARLFASPTGGRAAQSVGNESVTLALISSLSLEILHEFLQAGREPAALRSGFGTRCLSVPGQPGTSPTLLLMDPALEVSQSRRVTDELDLDPQGLVWAFERLRPLISGSVDPRLLPVLFNAGTDGILELMWVAQPEVVLSRRPRMVPLCAPTPFLEIVCNGQSSSVGIVCTDAGGTRGVTGCLHGTGPPGTPVQVGGLPSAVAYADAVQDIVFIPLPPGYPEPALYGVKGVRTNRAPSEAEPVCFEGAGTALRVDTRVKSHDAGILRRRLTVQLKVQTPADTNTGDSGSALVDDDDHIVGFGFERTAPGDFPELTDWVWAANALAALGLTPV